jgi:transposase-like protein
MNTELHSLSSTYKHLQGPDHRGIPYTRSPAPEGALLHRIDWHYFVTLTHENPKRHVQNSPERQIKRWFIWSDEVCRRLRINQNSFRWVRRWEAGRGGQEHFHALINFHKRRLVNKSTMHFLRGVWEGLGYGIANCRLCKTTGVQAYITKIQNEKELNRFGSERFRHVEFSKSVLKNLRRSTKMSAVHTGY